MALRWCIAAGTCLAIAAAGWVALGLRHGRPAILPPQPPGYTIAFDSGRTIVHVPGRALVANLGAFDDEFFAYLIANYLQGLAPEQTQVWLTCRREGPALLYIIRLGLPADLYLASASLRRLETAGGLTGTHPFWVSPQVRNSFQQQSAAIGRAYRLPARRTLERLPRSELASYIRRFIRFKALTDGRIRRAIDPVPAPPSRSEAQQLARDIVAIAGFYSLPIDFFLGIGAMENNYMNVPGDLGNSIWKPSPGRGDVILRRGPKGVLVLNEASGVWQITRETLRYAHRLYLSDTRDYSALPAPLRPPERLDLNEVPHRVLTTYAGLFFRHLIDRFHGDIAKAVGAYNGGPGNPNPRYEAGARAVAKHARRVLEHAAALHGRPAAEMNFLKPARPSPVRQGNPRPSP